MSYATIILFREGEPQQSVEFRNSWGGAARIWDSLFKAHIPKKHEYDSWLGASENGDRRLWDLAIDERLPIFERAVHAFTFDHFYVRKEHFKMLAHHLRQFVSKFPVPGKVDHLTNWADLIEKSDADAVALYATSVSENLWRKYDEESDKETEVPLSEGWEVYDWIEDQERKAVAK